VGTEKRDLNRNGGKESAIPSTIGKFCLVVEDNAANFFLVARLLENLGVHSEWKTSGYEVAEYVGTLENVDFIFMDIMLPYDDGFAAMRKIRQDHKFDNIPIIAVTALATEEEMNKAILAGFNGFLSKPLDPDEFPKQIKKILAHESVWDLNK
jgi:two-component system, cell cycle response regulator DivK